MNSFWQTSERETSETHTILFDGVTLGFEVRISNLKVLEVQHDHALAALPFSTAMSTPFDFRMTPTRGFLESQLENGTQEASLQEHQRNVTISFSPTTSGLQLNGTAYFGSIEPPMTWSATYGNYAVPTRFDIDAASSTGVSSEFLPHESFRLSAVLIEFAPASSPAVTQAWGSEAPTAPSSQSGNSSPQNRTWLDLFSGQASSLAYPLSRAWPPPHANITQFDRFVQHHNLTFPAFLSYYEVDYPNDTRGQEWNVTFCTGLGDCMSRVLVLNTDGTGESSESERVEEGHRFSGGNFSGPKFSITNQTKSLRSFVGFGNALSHFAALGGPPIKRIELGVARQLETEGGTVTLTLLEISHGKIVRLNVDEGNGFRWKSQLANSLFFASDGKPFSTLAPVESPPSDWS